MCKSKTRTDATEPGATYRTSRRSKPSPSRTPRSSITDPSTSNITSLNFTTGSSYRDSSRNSVSSRTSLSGIRGSLPENPHIYDFSEISNATNNFLAKRHPPASAAWRCSIRGKDVIVFQRKLRRSIEASRLRELLSLICRSNHASLIKLLGVSISGNYIYFVYDYVNGANLKDCLRNPKNPNYTVLSTWMSRMKIATDLAEVVDYIHNSIGSNQSFVHNHITSASVIVTEPSFLAKLCHFGTAELSGEIPEDQQNEQKSEISEISVASSSSASSSKLKRSGSRIIKLEGTRGYMSPEFQSTGVPTQKSDVYAFGVVILELLSGQEPLKYRVDEEQGNYSRISVIETATEASGGGGEEGREGGGGGGGGGGRLRNWMDRRLKDSFPVEVAERMTRLALECVHVDPEMRPDMRDVAGRMSKLYLMSMNWADTMRLPTDFSVSLAPR